MAMYFTSEHFKALKKWQGQKRDDSQAEQNRAYEALKEAYEVTEAWAQELQRQYFPLGRYELRKRPTNQANKFAAYNWAKVYPAADVPKGLAYTLGIDAELGFYISLDTVGLDGSHPAKIAYLKIFGEFRKGSPLVGSIPATDGLDWSLSELVTWSISALKTFKHRYFEVARVLSLEAEQSDEDLLRHFDSKAIFKVNRFKLSEPELAPFCSLVRAIHAAGLDWWSAGQGIRMRFGRKEPNSEHATAVFGEVDDIRLKRLKLKLGDAWPSDYLPLTNDSVDQVIDAIATKKVDIEQLHIQGGERLGLWPDQLTDDNLFGPDSAFSQRFGDGQLLPEDDKPAREPKADPTTRSSALNRIYYGPPGTGKTYAVTKLLQRDYEQATTLVSKAGWQGQFIADRIASLKWWEGAVLALIDIGGQANVSRLLEHPFIDAISNAKGRKKNVRQTIWGTLQERSVDESTTVKTKLRLSPQVFDKSEESVWRLVGEWEDSCADLVALLKEYKAGAQSADPLRRYSFVTFHQSYGYEEFVEGLRPVLDDDTESGAIKYEIRPGSFKDLCRRARLAPEQRFAMVIDEINRGNISKIFGELITLIEPDKREGAAHAISVTLPYSGESFSVPANVDIIGTMNTADRSLALLDTALRRRFDFVPVLPDVRDEAGAPLYGLRVTLGEQVIDVPRMLAAINQRVEALYDRDHCIGHAYFTSLARVPDGDERLVALSEIFSNRIVPLLEEYFFEDWQKIRLVLADNQKPEDARFVTESQDHEEDLARLFGSNHGLDSYGTKQRYVVQDATFTNPKAYIGIYQTLPV